MVEKIKNFIQNAPEIIKEKLKNVPTTSLMAVSAVVMSIFSVVAFWFLLFFEKTIDSISLGLLFTFLASWMGLNTRQFRIKRETDFSFVKAKQDQS